MKSIIMGGSRRNSVRYGAIVGVVVAIIAAAPAWSAEPTLPSGATILDAFVEATGGTSAYDKIRSRVTHGSMSVVEAGLEGDVTVYLAKGNMYFAWDAAALGKVETGVHDGIAWENNPMSGARVKEGAERLASLRMAKLDNISHWRNHFETADCVGIELVGERSCYKVVVTAAGENPMTHYYDTESALQVKVEVQMPSPQGTIDMQVALADYREVDGLLVPFQVTYTYDDTQTMVFTTTRVEHNVDIPDSRFALPEVVQAELDTRRTETAQ